MKLLKLGRSAVSLCLSAALTLASLGPGAAEALAASIQTGASKPLPGTPQVSLLPGAPFPAAPGSASDFAGTPVFLTGTIPSLGARIIETGGGASLAGAPEALPETAAPAVAGVFAPAVMGVPAAPAAAGVAAVPAPGSSLKASAQDPDRASGKWSGVSVESLGRVSRDAVELPKAAAGSFTASKEWAQDSFSYLKGETGSFAPSALPVEGGPSAGGPGARSGLAPASPRKTGSAVRLLGKAAAVLGAGTLVGTFAFPGQVEPSPGPLVAASAATRNSDVLPILGQAGYAVGNILGAVFSLPQVYKTFQDGHSRGTPMWRAAVLAAANLALGIVSATVANRWLWGVQNIFAAVTILAVIPIGAWLSRRGKSLAGQTPAGEAGPSSSSSRLESARKRVRALFANRALLATLAVAGLGAGLSFGIYYAALAAVPSALAHLLGAAGVAKLVLGIQAVTGGMYFLLFLPDIVSILRGKAPNGFTPGVSLSFFIASMGFILWTGQTVLESQAGSPQRQQFIIYLALNAAYAVVSLSSWLITRRGQRASS